MPILHGFIVSARSKMVSMPISLDLLIIFTVATSTERSSGLDTFFGEIEADKKKSKEQPKAADKKIGATKKASDATKDGEIRATFIV